MKLQFSTRCSVRKTCRVSFEFSARPIYEQMAIIEAKKAEVVEKSQSLVGPHHGRTVEFTDLKKFGDLVKLILLDDNNPELKALVISKFVKKVEVGEEKVVVHYYVGENLGSNRLTSGGPTGT